jgi:hypothetical protein
MAVLFDTLKLAQDLEKAGMIPTQTQGTTAAIGEAMRLLRQPHPTSPR